MGGVALSIGLAPWAGAALASALDEPRVIEIAAKRFAFEPEVIEVRHGERVRLVLYSEDVEHGFEIKAYDVKVKIPKGGERVSVEFVAEHPGTFRITCSEYCGSGHRRMRGELVVEGGGEGDGGSGR